MVVRQRQDRSYKQEMETHGDGINPVFTCVASDLSDEGSHRTQRLLSWR